MGRLLISIVTLAHYALVINSKGYYKQHIEVASFLSSVEDFHAATVKLDFYFLLLPWPFFQRKFVPQGTIPVR